MGIVGADEGGPEAGAGTIVTTGAGVWSEPVAVAIVVVVSTTGGSDAA